MKQTTAVQTISTTQAERLRDVLCLYGGFLLLGLAYLAFVRLTGWRIPCPFYTVTGFLCPGCGITRMMVALSLPDLAAAYAANPAVFCAAPLLIALRLQDDYRYIRHALPPSGHRIIYPLLLIYFLGFGIWRNIC